MIQFKPYLNLQIWFKINCINGYVVVRCHFFTNNLQSHSCSESDYTGVVF